MSSYCPDLGDPSISCLRRDSGALVLLEVFPRFYDSIDSFARTVARKIARGEVEEYPWTGWFLSSVS